MKKIRLLIVDDSAVFRGIIERGVSADPDIETVAIATDPYEARDKIIEFSPDVVVYDVVMPKMNGIEFIRRLLPQYPIRVIVMGSVSDAALDAMNAGAVDFVAKPNISIGRTKDIFLQDLISKIKIAASANINIVNSHSDSARDSVLHSVRNQSAASNQNKTSSYSKKIIAIGASTGGTEAIFNILNKLPPDLPGIVIVQHIPPEFSRMFAERMNKSTLFSVRVAKTGDFVESGHVLIAPGDMHMRVKRLGSKLRVETFTSDKVNGHCPSADVLFESVAAACGEDAVGVILTGMGDDGARGLLSMKKAGAPTIGQDEKTSVVYGMPKVAYEIGAVEKQYPLHKIPKAIIAASQ